MTTENTPNTPNPDFENVQTAARDFIMTYLSQLADVHYNRRLNEMYERMMEGFLRHKPWIAFPPLEWRMAKSITALGDNEKPSPEDWVAVNMLLPQDLANRMKAEITHINVNALAMENRDISRRTFLYTAIYWWVTYVYPYQGVRILPQPQPS